MDRFVKFGLTLRLFVYIFDACSWDSFADAYRVCSCRGKRYYLLKFDLADSFCKDIPLGLAISILP